MSSEQLERQTEQSRADVEKTLGELRARLTPGQLVDEILSYAKDGGAHFIGNLGKQVTANPLPVTLIGAGLAWFLMGKPAHARSTMSESENYNANWDSANWDGGSRAYDSSGSHIGEGIGNVARKAGDAMGSAAHSVRDMAESAGSTVSGTARSLGDSASSAYHSASAKVKDAASSIAGSATSLEQRSAAAARDMIAMMTEQPLILVGVGLAIGAALGAAVPNTAVENRLMGEEADKLKKEATDLATDQLSKAKDTAQRLIEENMGQPPQGNGSGASDLQGQFR